MSSEKEVVLALRECPVPPTVGHHAMVVYRLLLRTLGSPLEKYTPDTIACACLLFTLKERNRTDLSRCLSSLRKRTDATEVTVLEMWMIETIREKVVLIEGCLRLVYQQFLSTNPKFLKAGEAIITLALCLVKQLYETDSCLFPESSANAAVLAACEAAGCIDEIEVPPEWLVPRVQEIAARLVASAQAAVTES